MILNSEVHACRYLIEAALANFVRFTYTLDLTPEISCGARLSIKLRRQVALYTRLPMSLSSPFDLASGFDITQGTHDVVFTPLLT
jgi:hypothetical protein